MEDASERTPVPPEVRVRLDGYLDAVEAALVRAGTTRDARRAVTDDLEAQLLEMLEERTEGRAATREVVDGLISQLEPPQAYADPSFVESRTRRSELPSRPLSHVNKRNHMKSLFLLVLVVCGTLIVLAPAVLDYANQRRLVEIIIARPEFTDVTMSGVRMEQMSRLGFWFTGTVMIVVAIVCGLRRRPMREA